MVLINGQATDDNVFRQSENSGSSSSDTPQNGQPVTEEPNNGPGNPGGPVPIDQYIPFLLVLAAGLVIYTQRKESGKIY